MNLPVQFKPKTDIQEMMETLGCTGDRVKPQDIVDRIEEIDFQTVNIAGNKFMYCGIRMIGGFVVVGKPATCIDPDNWRDEIGQQVSFNNTFEEIYKLEAYRKMGAPKPAPAPDKLGFHQYESKPVTRTAYQLTKRDLVTMTWNHDLVSNTAKAMIQIEGKKVVFAFHCRPDEIKTGDYVVFLNENDTYHCSEEVFNERNIT
ncbi:MAG: Gp49 family protein [Vibrio toranzoniae]|uniref:Gp49 family protein n=1 Tax=Vibrio toranzoniae TaxID=1194427 RepID=UPI003C6B2CAF